MEFKKWLNKLEDAGMIYNSPSNAEDQAISDKLGTSAGKYSAYAHEKKKRKPLENPRLGFMKRKMKRR